MLWERESAFVGMGGACVWSGHHVRPSEVMYELEIWNRAGYRPLFVHERLYRPRKW